MQSGTAGPSQWCGFLPGIEKADNTDLREITTISGNYIRDLRKLSTVANNQIIGNGRRY